MTQQPPKLAGFSHVSLSVRDRATSLRFYQDLLGFFPIDEVSGDGWTATVCAHPSGAIVDLQHHDANAGEVFDHRRTGLDHLALRVAQRGDLDAWQQYLSGLRVPHSPVAERDYGAVLCLRDPDGIQLELFYRDGHP
jgi:glyoxylase I family protein